MLNKLTAAMLFCGGCFVLAGCASLLEVDQLRQLPEFAAQKPLKISKVPFFPQQEYQCGPAALAILLNWSGVTVTPDQLTSLVYVPQRKGSYQAEMLAAARQYRRIPYEIKPDVRSLLDEIAAGHPVLVFQNLGLSWYPQWHYAVVTGIDLVNNTIQLHSGTIKDHVMMLDTFERTWQRANKWAMVVLTPGAMPASVEPLSYVKAIAYFESKGDLTLALQAYQAGLQRWPDSLLVLMGAGNVLYRQRQLQQAQLMYGHAIELNPDYAPAHNNLAQVFLELGKLPEALAHAQRAVQLGGEHIANYQDTLQQIQVQLTGNGPQ